MSLEEQAAERKARLASLRSKRKPESQKTTDTTQIATKKSTSDKSYTLKSRNFDLLNRTEIKGFELPPTILDENSETVEAVTQRMQEEVLSKFRQQAQSDLNEVESKKIKPKSLSWDMQRDIQDDLDLLQEKTDDAIKAIVKERIRKLREAKPHIEEN